MMTVRGVTRRERYLFVIRDVTMTKCRGGLLWRDDRGVFDGVV